MITLMLTIRYSVMDEMRRLVDKYPEGYEAWEVWAREKGLI